MTSQSAGSVCSKNKKTQKKNPLKTFGSTKVHQKTIYTLQTNRKTVPMANMNNRVDAFITENGLDENIKDALIELVNGCFADYVGHMSKDWISNSNKSTSVPKTKKEKLDDPTQAEAPEDLRKCTVDVLNLYCRTHDLKIGGNKRDIMDRVWRHVQGDSSDDDLGRAAKPKKTKPVKEVHTCFACNSKGAPCGIAATEEYSGHWFCFHHIDNATELVAAKKSVVESEPESDSEEESEEEEEPVVVPEKKKKTSKK